MALQELDLSGPIRYAQTLKQASEAQDLQEQQKTEGQLNIKKLQMAIDQATKDQKENDQIKARIAQGGDPESIAADINKINPDKGAKYYQDLRAQQLAKRQEAIQNYQANPNPAMPLQSVAQPPLAVAAPQPVVAPAPNLLGSTAPAPQPQTPSILRNVNLPNRWQMAPAPDVTIPSATGGEPLVIPGVNQEQAIAREQAAKRFATDEAIRAKAAEGVVIPADASLLQNGVLTTPHEKQNPAEVKFSNSGIPYAVQGADKITRVIGDPNMPAADKALADKAVGDHAQSIKDEIDKETRMNANRADLADTAAKHAELRAAEKAGNDPRVKDVPEADRHAAYAAVLKATNDLADAKAASDRMTTVLNLAKSGNKEAQASAALVGVQAINEMAGIKRVNQAEISAYGNAGSLIDRLEGKLGKLVAGKPIPDDILKDMQDLHDAFGSNADTIYSRKIQGVDKTFRSTFGATAPATGSGSTDEIRKILGLPPKGK